jgi:glycosidase
MWYRSSPVLALVVFFACTPPQTKIPETMPDPAVAKEKVVVYQMMTRLFGNTKTLNKRYGTRDENGVGKFNDISPAALQSLKVLGATHIWYTGVLEHAVLTDYTAYGIPLDDADVVKGRAGSPYAIKDYYDVNPDLAVDVSKRIEEFEALIARTHEQGLRVVIDLVPNHVARAYKSDAKPVGVKDFGEGDDSGAAFKPSNNFYYLPGQTFQPPREYVSLGADNTFPTKGGGFQEVPAKATGNDQFTATPGVNEWFETVKLNYGVDIQGGRKTYFDPIPNTWEKVHHILAYWAAKGVDGFRCDMAEMVPVEFWQWVIPKIKSAYPDVIFIAEIYNPNEYRNYIERGHFDYLYDKVQLYDTLRGLIRQERSSADIPHIQNYLAGINHQMLHFLENHDEQRIASPAFAGDPWKALSAMVVSATIDQGPIMIYFGQEVGEPGAGEEGFNGNDGRTTIFDYWGVPEHQKWLNGGKFDGGGLSEEQKALRQFYGDLLNLAKTNPAIVRGNYFDITHHNLHFGNIPDKVLAYVRANGDEKLLIIAGFNPQPLTVKLQLPEAVRNQIGLTDPTKFIGRDLLRSGAEVGFDGNFTCTVDVPPFGYYILKLK